MNVSSGSPVFMMPLIGVPKQSLTTGFVLNKPAAIDVPLYPISSPHSEGEVDYFREDVDFGYDPHHPDTSKFSHLVIEDMEVTPPTETVSCYADITSTESKI